ncbi:MAG: hypothetical protein ACTSSH_03075 [Candidatus Heimdallarchaeota archaeon]
MISSRNKPMKKNALLLGMLVFTSLFFVSFIIQPSSGLDDFISSSSDMEKYVVKDLESGITYRFRVESEYFVDDYDIGFAIYDSDRFRESDRLVLQDVAGDGDEEQIFTPTEAGDYYLAVWMNDGDYGFVIISVWEDGTSNYMIIEELGYIFSLRWLWITLGVILGVCFALICPLTIIAMRQIKRHQIKVAAARKQGTSLPRYGRKKNKCPFCKVNLPPEYQPKCPYCGAPISNE